MISCVLTRSMHVLEMLQDQAMQAYRAVEFNVDKKFKSK